MTMMSDKRCTKVVPDVRRLEETNSLMVIGWNIV